MESAVSAASGRPGPNPAFEPIIVNRPPLAARPTLKVVAFNARGGLHLETIVRCFSRPPLADADVILLCEADWRLRRSAHREFAADLAASLKMSFAYQAEFGIAGASVEPVSFLGNAILSSQPLHSAQGVPLSGAGWEWRRMHFSGTPTALAASATFGGRRIALCVVHLDSRWHPAGRARQMAELMTEFPYEEPALLGGDFNTTTLDLLNRNAILKVPYKMMVSPLRFRRPQRFEPLFERLKEAGFGVDGANVADKPTFTFSRVLPPFVRPKLDWIALRGLTALRGTAAVVPARWSPFARRISDHDFVMCEINL
jgi:endonuclease/exonuclease/phosphatase family metal-dependent hydrolase